MPKTIYGFPVKIEPICSSDKVYLVPLYSHSLNGIMNKAEWIFPYKMKITKELRKYLKKMICLQK